jgi:hypothetical protein
MPALRHFHRGQGLRTNPVCLRLVEASGFVRRSENGAFADLTGPLVSQNSFA